MIIVKHFRPASNEDTNHSMRHGYIAFTTLLIIATVATAVALTISTIAISLSQMTTSTHSGEAMSHLADACIEDALEKIKNNPSYSGQTFTLLGGTCTINATSAGNTWTVTVSATDGIYEKSREVTANRTNTVSITNWKKL